VSARRIRQEEGVMQLSLAPRLSTAVGKDVQQAAVHHESLRGCGPS